MAKNVKITTKGIKTILKRLKFSEQNFQKSIGEYIWNGFDAKASKVEIEMIFNKIQTLEKVSISDNGTGIGLNQLSEKFDPFYESDKVLADARAEKHSSLYHGKKGIGRLTFYTFAHFAKWTSVYKEKNKNLLYDVEINAATLSTYKEPDQKPLETKKNTGTLVSFSGFLKHMNDSKLLERLIEYLKYEFGWYLELNKEKGLKIIVNGEELDYSDTITNKEEIVLRCGEPEQVFYLKYVQWKGRPNDEYSRFYYLNSGGVEKYKEHTSLNNQGDEFYHSVYLKSKYFDDFNFYTSQGEGQQAISGMIRSHRTFKELLEKVYDFLKIKRKPFLKEKSEEIVNNLEKENFLFFDDKSEIDKIKKNELKFILRNLYETEPKIFSNLNQEQKTTFIGLLNLILDTDERDRIITIIEKIVRLEPGEREELANVLKVTELSNLIETIKLIQKRYQILQILKRVNFDINFKANEVDHLQKIIEDNTWVFAEQYSLVAFAEDDFEKALKNHRKILCKDDKEVDINHPDKRGQVDLFICKQQKNGGKVHNIIIELKHPAKNIGEKELSQVNICASY